MRNLAAANLLADWEQGVGRSTDEQALILLATALPNTRPESLARLPIGQRDAVLLTLREQVFGSRLVSRALCPVCAESLELDFTVSDIRVPGYAIGDDLSSANARADPAGVPLRDDTTITEIAHAGYQVRFRLPNTLDLRAATRATNLKDARTALLEHCVIEARHAGSPIAAVALPESVGEAISKHMLDMDPQADIRLSLTCPACSHAWQAPFDIGTYFWEELHAWALRMLREVHILAYAYGWSEGDILALSPARRQLYLDMVQG